MHALLLADRSRFPSPAAKALIVLGLFGIASFVSAVLGGAVGRLRARVESIPLESPLVAIARRERARSFREAHHRRTVRLRR